MEEIGPTAYTLCVVATTGLLALGPIYNCDHSYFDAIWTIGKSGRLRGASAILLDLLTPDLRYAHFELWHTHPSPDCQSWTISNLLTGIHCPAMRSYA